MKRPALYRPKALEMVAVRWSDAQHDTEFDGDPHGYKGTLAATTDIGFFVSRSKVVTVLASCRDDAGGVRWLINIPTALVLSVSPLVEKEDAT